VKIAESRLKEAEQAVAKERKEIHAQGTEKKKQLEAASAEREKVIAPVPEDLRVLYDRIAKRHNGTAMAEAREGQCRGCGMRVLPHILQELRSETNEEVFRCESCGLILYTLEPIPIANTSVGSADSTSAASTNS
jgi:predicted  nucleic acid-binding Zn-ribbon protein